jgi:hypothetical protein
MNKQALLLEATYFGQIELGGFDSSKESTQHYSTNSHITKPIKRTYTKPFIGTSNFINSPSRYSLPQMQLNARNWDSEVVSLPSEAGSKLNTSELKPLSIDQLTSTFLQLEDFDSNRKTIFNRVWTLGVGAYAKTNLISTIANNDIRSISLGFISDFSLKLSKRWGLSATAGMNFEKMNGLSYSYLDEASYFFSRSEKIKTVSPELIIKPEVEVRASYDWSPKWRTEVGVYSDWMVFSKSTVETSGTGSYAHINERTSSYGSGALFNSVSFGLSFRQSFLINENWTLFVKYNHGFSNRLNSLYFNQKFEGRQFSLGVIKNLRHE